MRPAIKIGAVVATLGAVAILLKLSAEKLGETDNGQDTDGDAEAREMAKEHLRAPGT